MHAFIYEKPNYQMLPGETLPSFSVPVDTQRVESSSILCATFLHTTSSAKTVSSPKRVPLCQMKIGKLWYKNKM